MLALVLIMLVGGCGGDLGPRLNTPADIDLNAKGPTKLHSRRGSTASASAGRGNYQLFEGTEQGLGDDTRDPPPGVVAADLFHRSEFPSHTIQGALIELAL